MEKGHPPCPTKWGPPPGHSKDDGDHHPCGKAKGKQGASAKQSGKGARGKQAASAKQNGKGAKGGIILVLPMTVMTAAYAVRPKRLRLRRRAR